MNHVNFTKRIAFYVDVLWLVRCNLKAIVVENIFDSHLI